jgi:3-hydroxyacyl-CoA dehydrogenase
VELEFSEVSVEVKIGIADTARELVLTSTLSPDEVEALVSDALGAKGTGTLTLVDDKGRRFVVPAARVAYVEIGAADTRRVGFATA